MRKVSAITSLTALALSATAATTVTAATATAAPATRSVTAAPGTRASPKPVVRVQGMHLVHVQLPRTHLPHLARLAVVKSGNWSGYAAVARKGVRLKFISASFSVPSVNCQKSTLGSSGFAYASNWAGLDGFNSATVEQTGVDSFCDASGNPQYDAWYELFPLQPVVFSGVSAGDAMSASVFYTGSGYSITLTDLTSGGKIQTTRPCPRGATCKNSSAEVITEDPGMAAPTVDLADFGMVNVTGAAVTSLNGTHGSLTASSLWTSSEILMTNSAGKVMSQPSGLFGGKAYNVTWRLSQ
jgi:hypothetical protein